MFRVTMQTITFADSLPPPAVISRSCQVTHFESHKDFNKCDVENYASGKNSMRKEVCVHTLLSAYVSVLVHLGGDANVSIIICINVCTCSLCKEQCCVQGTHCFSFVLPYSPSPAIRYTSHVCYPHKYTDGLWPLVTFLATPRPITAVTQKGVYLHRSLLEPSCVPSLLVFAHFILRHHCCCLLFNFPHTCCLRASVLIHSVTNSEHQVQMRCLAHVRACYTAIALFSGANAIKPGNEAQLGRPGVC